MQYWSLAKLSPRGSPKEKPPWTFCVTEDAIPRRGDHSAGTVIIRHPVWETLGKQTCSKFTTMKTFQSVKHWEAQTPINKIKIPLEKGRLARTGGMTRPSHCKEIYKNEGLIVEWKHLCNQWVDWRFHSTWVKFCLGGFAKGAKATPVCSTLWRKHLKIYTSYVSHEWLVGKLI